MQSGTLGYDFYRNVNDIEYLLEGNGVIPFAAPTWSDDDSLLLMHFFHDNRVDNTSAARSKECKELPLLFHGRPWIQIYQQSYFLFPGSSHSNFGDSIDLTFEQQKKACELKLQRLTESRSIFEAVDSEDKPWNLCELLYLTEYAWDTLDDDNWKVDRSCAKFQLLIKDKEEKENANSYVLLFEDIHLMENHSLSACIEKFAQCLHLGSQRIYQACYQQWLTQEGPNTWVIFDRDMQQEESPLPIAQEMEVQPVGVV